MQSNDFLIDNLSNQGHNKEEWTHYQMFKYSIKTETTRRYYERRLKRFFDLLLQSFKTIDYTYYFLYKNSYSSSFIPIDIICKHMISRYNTSGYCDLCQTPQGTYLTKRRKALRKGTTITTDLINYIN